MHWKTRSLLLLYFIYHVFCRVAQQVSTCSDTSIESYLRRVIIGTGSVTTTIYLTDISPRTMRGNIVTFHQLFIVIGILVGQIVGLPWILGRHK